MKVSKVFGCVLGLHFCVIAVLLVQPGCQSKQPPTQTVTQSQTISNPVAGASRASGELIPATRVDSGPGLDAAFNAGFEGNDNFEEFDDVAPIAPITNASTDVPMVEVTGTSFETYTVKKGDSLWSISRRYDVSVNELYAANGLNKNSVLSIGQQIQIPVEGGTASVATVSPDAYQPTSFNQESTSYTVKRGDNLSKIAVQYNTSVRAIKAANGKSSDVIRVGETLLIPVSGAPAPQVNAAPVTPVVSSSSPSPAGTHTVRAGEYPGKIARQYGMTSAELLALNGITDPRKLQVGQVLKVSSGSSENVDSRIETVTPAPTPSKPAVTSVTATPVPTNSFVATPTTGEQVEIKVVEADPIIEGDVIEVDTDDLFEGAVEIPVIRLEE